MEIQGHVVVEHFTKFSNANISDYHLHTRLVPLHNRYYFVFVMSSYHAPEKKTTKATKIIIITSTGRSWVIWYLVFEVTCFVV